MTFPLCLAAACTLLSLTFQFLVVEKIGVGLSSDLYYAGTIISLMLYSLTFDPLNSVLIPMYVEKFAKGEDVDLLWNSLLIVVLLGCLMLVVSYYPALAAFRILFKRIAVGNTAQVGRIFVAFCLYQIVYSAIIVKNCFLYSRGRATSSQAGLACGWLVSIGALSLHYRPIVNLSHIVYCLVIGNVAALFFPNLDLKVFSFKRKLLRRHAMELASRVGPVLVGSAPYKGESLIDGAIASMCGVGGITVYYLFGRLILSIATVSHLGYIQPETKRLADIATRERGPELRWRARTTAVRCVLLSFGMLVPMVSLLVGMRVFDIKFSLPYLEAFETNFSVLVLMFGYLVGMQVFRVYANALFVIGREKSFAVISIFCFGAGVLFKLAGAHWIGLPGLAAGTSAYWLFYAFAITFVFLVRVDGKPGPFENVAAARPRPRTVVE
ncbi:MAG TPA: hypothetical protein VN682_19425 [Terriglobales bacterium]|nr:hypothetical protein [Terriglobales bacterium]